jgi:hypothetical protein
MKEEKQTKKDGVFQELRLYCKGVLVFSCGGGGLLAEHTIYPQKTHDILLNAVSGNVRLKCEYITANFDSIPFTLSVYNCEKPRC